MKLPENLKDGKTQALVIGATFALFLIVTVLGIPILPILLGIVIAIEIFAFVGLEVKSGVKAHGWKNELIDTVIALAVRYSFGMAPGSF